MAQTDLIVKLQGKDNLSPVIGNAKKQLTDFGKEGSKLDDISKKFQSIQNSSAPLGRKIRDIKKAMEEMSVKGLDATKEGKKMWQELAAEAGKYDAQLKKINEDIKGASAGKGGFDIKGMGQEMASKLGVGEAFGAITAAANPATLAVAAVGGTMIAAGKKAAEYEVHLDALQALTGVTDAQMKEMSATTLDMSKKFGMGAGDIADAMGLIGSQAPELLKNTDALATVTDAAMTLAKAGSISAEAAGAAITTVTNQMGVSASEAMNIANTLEAAEQQGSASVEYLNKAIEKSGTQAKGAGMSYGELISMIEAVAPKFSSADVAGSQLNSTLLKLSMGADEFNPAVVGMKQALENLSSAQLSNEQLSKMVGESNIVMVKTMMEAKDSYAGFTETLVGTNAAVDAWQTKTGNMEGAIDRLKATWDAFLITLGQSGLIQGIADNIMVVMEALGEVCDIISEVIESFGAFETEGIDSTFIVKKQLDDLIRIIRGVATALEIIIAVCAKVFNYLKTKAGEATDWIGEKWTALKKNLGDTGFGKVVIATFNAVMKAVATVVNKIKKWWNDMCEFLGLDSKKIAEVEAPTLEAPSNANTTSNTTTSGGGGSSSGGGGKSGGKSGGGKGSTAKVEVVPEEGSIKDLEKRISKINEELTTTNVSDERRKELMKQREELEKQVAEQKKLIGLSKETAKEGPAKGSIKDLQNALSKINEELNNTNVSEERLAVLTKEREELEKQIKDLQIRNGLAKAVDPVEQKRTDYSNANSKIDQVKADFKLGIIDKDQAQARIEEANALIQSIGLEPIELHVNDDGTITTSMEELEAYQQKMSQTAGQIGEIGSAFSTMGQAVGGTTGTIMEFAGQTLGAVAQIIPQIVSLIAAKQAEAMAAGTASAAAMPFPANLAAMASIIATVVSLFASIPKAFADGGIVGGNSFHGDTMLARVNSGEMILNTAQQSALYRSLNNGGVGNGISGNVTFTLTGDKLKGCLNNYDAKQKKIK